MLSNADYGKKGWDVVTGFAGLVNGFCEYWTGCSQVLLTPKVSESGELREGKWFDIGWR